MAHHRDYTAHKALVDTVATNPARSRPTPKNQPPKRSVPVTSVLRWIGVRVVALIVVPMFI